MTYLYDEGYVNEHVKYSCHLQHFNNFIMKVAGLSIWTKKKAK